MTQNTQTTAERIEEVITYGFERDHYGIILDYHVEVAAAEIAAELDGLAAQLAEARADLAKCGADLQYEFDNPGDSRRRIAELEAEVERLRPAAEAWEAMEAWRNPSGRTVSGVDMAYKAMVAAAARAREAKERKP